MTAVLRRPGIGAAVPLEVPPLDAVADAWERQARGAGRTLVVAPDARAPAGPLSR